MSACLCCLSARLWERILFYFICEVKGFPLKTPWKPLEIEFFPWKKYDKLPLEPLEINPINVLGTLISPNFDKFLIRWLAQLTESFI